MMNGGLQQFGSRLVRGIILSGFCFSYLTLLVQKLEKATRLDRMARNFILDRASLFFQ